MSAYHVDGVAAFIITLSLPAATRTSGRTSSAPTRTQGTRAAAARAHRARPTRSTTSGWPVPEADAGRRPIRSRSSGSAGSTITGRSGTPAPDPSPGPRGPPAAGWRFSSSGRSASRDLPRGRAAASVIDPARRLGPTVGERRDLATDRTDPAEVQLGGHDPDPVRTPGRRPSPTGRRSSTARRPAGRAARRSATAP